jgi:hypothetical protein
MVSRLSRLLKLQAEKCSWFENVKNGTFISKYLSFFIWKYLTFHLKILIFLLIIFLLESVPSPLEKNKISKIKYRSMKCEKSKTDTAQNWYSSSSNKRIFSRYIYRKNISRFFIPKVKAVLVKLFKEFFKIKMFVISVCLF